jgi:hypothetical protein
MAVRPSVRVLVRPEVPEHAGGVGEVPADRVARRVGVPLPQRGENWRVEVGDPAPGMVMVM